MKPASTWPVWLLMLGVLGVGLLPWLIALLDLSMLHQAFRPFCHQEPERSLFFGGTQMVVCSRCAGIYSGLVLGVFFALPSQNFKWFRQLMFLALFLMGLDVLTQDLGLRPPWHATRLSTGFLLGFVLAAWPITLLFKDLKRTQVSETTCRCHSKKAQVE